MRNYNNRIFFMGLSGSGKTTLIEKTIQEISEISVSTIKFIHHAEFTVDPAYKDTRRHRNSGSVYTVCYAPTETILLINEEKRGTMQDFDELYNKLPPVDLVLIESLNNPPKGSTIILILKDPNDIDYYKHQLAHLNVIAIICRTKCNLGSDNQFGPILNMTNFEDFDKLISVIRQQLK